MSRPMHHLGLPFAKLRLFHYRALNHSRPPAGRGNRSYIRPEAIPPQGETMKRASLAVAAVALVAVLAGCGEVDPTTTAPGDNVDNVGNDPFAACIDKARALEATASLAASNKAVDACNEKAVNAPLDDNGNFDENDDIWQEP